MKHKSEVFDHCRTFYKWVETQFSRKIKILHSDNGGKYLSHSFAQFLQDYGVESQLSRLSTPQENGLAERNNRHLLEVARSFFFTMHVPQSYWLEAVLTS